MLGNVDAINTLSEQHFALFFEGKDKKGKVIPLQP